MAQVIREKEFVSLAYCNIQKLVPHQVIEDVGENNMVYRVQVLVQTRMPSSESKALVTQVIKGHHDPFLSTGLKFFGSDNQPLTKRQFIEYQFDQDGSRQIRRREIDISSKSPKNSTRQGKEIT